MLSCSQAEHQIKITQFSQKHAPAPAPIVPFTHLSQTTESCLQYLVTCNPTLHSTNTTITTLGLLNLNVKSSFFFQKHKSSDKGVGGRRVKCRCLDYAITVWIEFYQIFIS